MKNLIRHQILFCGTKSRLSSQEFWFVFFGHVPVTHRDIVTRSTSVRKMVIRMTNLQNVDDQAA